MKRSMLGLVMGLGLVGSIAAAVPVAVVTAPANVATKEVATTAVKSSKKFWIVGGIAVAAVSAYLLYTWLNAEETTSTPAGNQEAK
jgi:phosphotransferase system  glucose/maltose/N-acetylglucosamine-specific IIC component